MLSSVKKYYIIILSLVVLLLFGNIVRQEQKEQRLAKKVEELGIDEFSLHVWDSSVHMQDAQEVDIQWWMNEENGRHYLFVPSVICDRLCYVFNKYDSIIVDNIEVRPGDDFVLEEGSHLLLLESGEQYTLEVMYSNNLSSMYINTDLGDLRDIHESKDNMDTGRYLLLDEMGKVNCRGRLESIRCRGNMTFDAADKKSYSIRMEDKTAVLDLGVAKGWSLLANAFDEGLTRNYVVTEIAKAMNMSYVPDMEYVDLYINGVYQGNYQLAEKVEIAKERLNIRNLEDEMKLLNPEVDFDYCESIEKPVGEFKAYKWIDEINVPEDFKSGYLLELEMTYRYYEEKCGFITSRKQPVVIDSPQAVSYEQVDYVANLYQDMEDTLCSDTGYNEETRMYYYDYLNLHSFAQKYLIDEFSKNMDAAITSFFMYIPENDIRFYAGPVWDYDRTFGVDFERSGIDLKDPYTLYVSENTDYEQADINFWYLLCLQEGFQDLYKEMYWNEFRDIAVDVIKNKFDYNVARIENSAMMDAVRCNSFDGETISENREKFYEVNASIKAFMEKRIEFLDNEWE